LGQLDIPQGLAYYHREAVLGGEIAVPCTRNPLRGAELPFEGLLVWGCPGAPVLRAGSGAAETHEPRQVRKEAAVRGTFWVPPGCLA